MINLYNADSLQAIKTKDTNYYDLAICDPPFGIGNFVQTSGNYKDGCKHRNKKVDWNNKIPSQEYFSELKRVSRHQIIFGANYFNCFHDKGGAIVWIKNHPMPNFSKAVIASCSFHQKIEVYTQTWTNFVAKGRTTTHTCEMPVGIYMWILKNYAKKNDLILDTHMGSGSIAIACDELGFSLDAYEINTEYYKQARDRLKKHQAQLKLF